MSTIIPTSDQFTAALKYLGWQGWGKTKEEAIRDLLDEVEWRAA